MYTRRLELAAQLLAVALTLSACGGGGSGHSNESGLPNPTEGKATIGGTFSSNGEPLDGETVTLSGPGTDAESITDAKGRFVFESVEPGSYTLNASAFVEDARSEQVTIGSPFDVPGYPCSAEGYTILNTALADDSGEQIGVFIATFDDSAEPFEVEAGDVVTNDISLECSTGA